eukprot:m.161321 g.161321  ORF g.161321 m.161321 type:complete len:131 (+) comp14572_c0_seq2:1478-1870(+)
MHCTVMQNGIALHYYGPNIQKLCSTTTCRFYEKANPRRHATLSISVRKLTCRAYRRNGRRARMHSAKQDLRILERGALLTLAPAVATCPNRQPRVFATQPLCYLRQTSILKTTSSRLHGPQRQRTSVPVN